MKTKIPFILVFCLFFLANVTAGVDQVKIDSLTKLVSTQKGQERIESLIQLSEIYRAVSLNKSQETDSVAMSYTEREHIESMNGVVLLSMGKTAALSGDYPLALDYMERALKALEKTKNYLVLSKAHIHIGMVYKDLAKYDEAITEFNKASEIAREHELPDQQAGSATSKATVYFSMGDYSNAAENYLEAIHLYKDLNDSSMYAMAAMNVGLVYWQWNKTDLALNMLLEAKVVMERKKQYVNLGRLLNNLGKIYYQDFKDTTKALVYYNESLAMRELTGHQLGKAIVLANLANIYSDRKQFDLAFDHYDKSLNISKSIGYKEGIALASYYLGIAYKKNQEFKKSNACLDSCLVIAKSYGLSAYLGLINEAKMTNYVALNNYDGFLEEYNTFSAACDSVRNELAELKFTATDAKNKAEDANHELNTAKQTIDRQQMWILIYQLSVVVLLLTLIGLFWKYLRQKN
ncbi:MAG: tetratricopeptide repeat protein [Bacteroidetes bacterium]|nr:tetratricopeptide repeat protein [Bacteroidota bacterium]